MTTLQGGLLTGPSNIAAYRDEETTFVGDLDLRVGYRVNQHLSVWLGYTLIYYSSVIRSGDLIDRVVNPTGLPPATLTGEARPTVLLQDADIWAQGISLGFELRY